MFKTASIEDVIRILATLPGDFRVGANVAGNFSVLTPDGTTVTHYINLDDAALHPLVGNMGAGLKGKGGLKT